GKVYYPVAWSPDGRYLTVIDVKSNIDQNICLLDVTTGEYKDITPHEGETKFVPQAWAADSSGFYFLTDYQHEFTGIAFYNISNAHWDWWESIDHDIQFVLASDDGQLVIWSVNEDGRTRLHGRNVQTGAVLTMPSLPLGVITGAELSPDG